MKVFGTDIPISGLEEFETGIRPTMSPLCARQAALKVFGRKALNEEGCEEEGAHEEAKWSSPRCFWDVSGAVASIITVVVDIRIVSVAEVRIVPVREIIILTDNIVPDLTPTAERTF